jgi:hypothetical protein
MAAMIPAVYTKDFMNLPVSVPRIFPIVSFVFTYSPPVHCVHPMYPVHPHGYLACLTSVIPRVTDGHPHSAPHDPQRNI